MRANLLSFFGFLFLSAIIASADGTTPPAAQSWIGIVAKDYVSNDNPRVGAVVDSVEPDSPAAKIGVAVGDVVTMWDGKKLASIADLERAVATSAVGKQYTVGVVRNFGWKWKFAERPIVVAGKATELA